ncbi:hypothetical protein FALBO_6137 [Fusarium albosuccineum]|uniref:MACPF domain-containing protein n=1 Tax=Fusarium albosuccineum TaxID=1237068 RepID=A0A8H4LF46_9HYPO|nr:hypothetical protein FALBO_6137 [Fusarium albosuccineum]
MTLEDVFPDNPCLPTLRYALSTQVPIVIGWTKAPMEIGTSFFAPADKNGKARFGNKGEGAFDHQDLSSTPLVFKRGSSGGHIETTASSSGSSQERVHADISAQIGGKFLGGSGRGQYDSNAAKSAGAIQSSTRVYYHCGRVSLWTLPRLSEKALHILRTAKEPAKTFSATFGDYFVAGYLLGGGNVSMFSGAGGSESRSKRLNIDVEVHLAFIKSKDKIHEESSMSAQAAAGTISVYDSLTDQHTEQPIGNIDSAFALWEDNKIRAEKLQDRVAAELSKMDLHDDDTIIPHTKCDELCRSGLVLELLMLPWTGLRDYTSAIIAPRDPSNG